MAQSPMMFRVMFTVISGFGLLIGAAVLLWGFSSLRAALATEEWPQTSGVILSAERTTSTSGGTSQGGSSGAAYGAAITYEYEVAGRQHVGSRLSFGEYTSSDPSHAQELLRRYAPGTSVTVYYDPDAPARAVLETGAGFGNWILLFVGAFMSVGSLFLLVMFWLFFAKRMSQGSTTIGRTAA